MKTLGKLKKNMGAAVLTLAAVSSLSMVAFAEEAKSVPMQKLVPSTTTAVAGGSEQTDMILTRNNESTGKLEISGDNGATWSEYDGKAFMMTPAMPAQKQ